MKRIAFNFDWSRMEGGRRFFGAQAGEGKTVSLPDDYIIDHDYTGKQYPKTKQIARCGNAVPPPFATALVRANFPDECTGIDLSTMQMLNKQIAV